MKPVSKFHSLVGLGALGFCLLIGCRIFMTRHSGVRISAKNSYGLYAEFENIGDLKVQSPVKIGGVTVGRVQSIQLNAETWQAKVQLMVERRYNTLPADSRVCVRTAGLLGETYLEIKVGDTTDANHLKEESYFQSVESAICLEDLIGKLLFSQKRTNK